MPSRLNGRLVTMKCVEHLKVPPSPTVPEPLTMRRGGGRVGLRAVEQRWPVAGCFVRWLWAQRSSHLGGSEFRVSWSIRGVGEFRGAVVRSGEFHRAPSGKLRGAAASFAEQLRGAGSLSEQLWGSWSVLGQGAAHRITGQQRPCDGNHTSPRDPNQAWFRVCWAFSLYIKM